MSIEISLEFSGPFAWSSPCVFDAHVSSHAGIYLWTVSTPEGDLIYYVGETGRDFTTRLTEHLKDQLAGMYRIYDPHLFLQGVKKPLWNGMFGRLRERGLSDFVAKLSELSPALIRYVQIIRFHLAPLECDDRFRKRIEAALADHLYVQDGVVGQFQDDDIRYERTRQDEEPLTVTFRWSGRVRGVPDRLFVSWARGNGAA